MAPLPYRTGMTVTIDQAAIVQIPVRIWRGRLTGMLFETDKCFLLPSTMPGIQGLKSVHDDHPGAEVLVTGHADRQGNENYNLDLSHERAEAIASFLRDRADDWLAWYGASKPPSKRWGVREDQYMLKAVTDGNGAPYYTGPVTGASNPRTKEAAVPLTPCAALADIL